MGLLPAPWRKLACTYAGIVAIQRGWIFQLATLAAATICVDAIRWAELPRSPQHFVVRAWASLPLILSTTLSFAALAFFESNPGYPIEAAVAFCAALLASLLKGSKGEAGRSLISSTSKLAGCLLLAAGLLLLESATVRLASDCASVGLAQLDVALAASWLLLGMSRLGADWCCRPSPIVTPSSSTTARVPVETSDPLPVIDLLTFGFLNATVAAGEARQLGLEDMLNVPPTANTAVASTRLLLQLGDRKDRGQSDSALPTPPAPRHVPSAALWASLASQYWRPWLALGGLQAASTALGFAGPALLNALLSFVGAAAATGSSGTGEASPWRGLLWAALLPLQAGVGALVSTQFAYRVQLLQLQVRASVTAAVFHRMLSCGAEATSGAVDAGAVVNFVSVDVQRLMDAVSSLHQLWSLPVQVCEQLGHRESHLCVFVLRIWRKIVSSPVSLPAAGRRDSLPPLHAASLGIPRRRVRPCCLHSAQRSRLAPHRRADGRHDGAPRRARASHGRATAGHALGQGACLGGGLAEAHPRSAGT